MAVFGIHSKLHVKVPSGKRQGHLKAEVFYFIQIVVLDTLH